MVGLGSVHSRRLMHPWRMLLTGGPFLLAFLLFVGPSKTIKHLEREIKMKILSIVAIAATMLSLSVAAEHSGVDSSVGKEVDVSFEVSKARLIAEGYHSIRMQNGDPQRLLAFNTEGSEVLVTISSQTGEISSTEYAQAMDK